MEIEWADINDIDDDGLEAPGITRELEMYKRWTEERTARISQFVKPHFRSLKILRGLKLASVLLCCVPQNSD